MTNLPSGTVTFLFTDIEGSTKLAQSLGEKWETLRARHHAVLQSAMDAYNGYVFQIIGDAFCVSFHAASDALNAAIDAQRKLHTEDWDTTPIKVRMGIHTGEAQVHGDEYHGYLTMSLVQRIMSAGHGGQILLSGATENLLRGGLPKDVTLRDMGEYKFKNVAYAVRVFQVITPELPSNFPALRALDVFPNNLPTQLTSFIGREKELADVKKLLQDAHMLTLIGPGGTGKTRLSIHAANESMTNYSDGVWLVELASILDPLLVPRTTAIAVGLREEPQRPVIDMLCDYLHDKNILLLLDNCEHLVDACAEMASRILQVAPKVRILASSREALGVAGEVTYRVPSLGFPDRDHLPSLDSMNQFEAVKLFIDRATSALPSFVVTNENAPSLAQICHRLDGIPLAIELAAAKVRMLSLEQIAKRLDDRFRLLTGGRRTALERHQTLRAAVDWSYNLLPPEEQTLFNRLSVFVGGWTLEAVESVCADESSSGVVGGEDVLNLLEQLINKSLVIADEERGESRYRMLETMRQYANEKLVESGESDHLHDRHLKFFVGLAETAEPHLRRTEQLEWLSVLDADHENLRAALAWSLDIPSSVSGLRLAGALEHFWKIREHLLEGVHWLKAVLQKDGNFSTPEELFARGRALLGLVEFMEISDDVEPMLPVAEEAFRIYENTNDSYYKALAYALLGLANRRNILHGVQLLKKSREMFKQLNDNWGQAIALVYLQLKYILMHLEGITRAEVLDLADSTETLSIASGDRYQIASALSWNAVLYCVISDPDRAEQLCDRAEHYEQELGIQVDSLIYYSRMTIAYIRGDHEQAKSLFQSMDRKLELIGNRHQRIWGFMVLSRVALEENQFEVAIENGLKISEIKLIGTPWGWDLEHFMLLGAAYFLKGDRRQALENIQSSLGLLTEQVNDHKTLHIAHALQGFCLIFISRDPAATSRLLGAAYAYQHSLSIILFEPYLRNKLSERLKTQIGEEAFNEAFAEGEMMSIEKAIEFAKSLVEKL